jgi:cysteine desulfuration protein SufE
MLADSDAKIVRGLVAILFSAYVDKSKAEIKTTDINDIFTQLGLEGHLSPSRRNGFYAMVERIQTIAAG